MIQDPSPEGTRGPQGPGVDPDQAHRILLLISLVMAGGIALFCGIAIYLVRTGAFTPFIGYPGWVRGAVGAGLILMVALSYPLYRLAGGSGAGAREYGPQELSALQTRVIVANGVREAVGIMGGVLILIAGDVLVGGLAAALAAAAIVLSLPSREDVRRTLGGR